MKLCRKCNVEKDIEAFELTQGRRRATCRACILIQRHARYRVDIEASRKKQKEYYERAGREKYRARYERSIPAIRASRLKTENTAKGRSLRIWSGAKKRAGDEFNLERSDIHKIVERGYCERTGILFDFTPPDGCTINPFSPSIDKIDRTKGYTKDNVQIVVWCYNTGKGQMTDEQFIDFCKTVAEHHK